METTLFSKENFMRMIGSSNCDENAEEWILKVKVHNPNRSCKIIINKNKIKDLSTKIKNTKFEKLSLYKRDHENTQTYFEHVVKVIHERCDLKIEPLETPELKISIDSLSDEYSGFFHLLDPSHHKPYTNVGKFSHVSRDAYIAITLPEEYDGKTIDFWELIRILNEKIFKIKSLKIKSTKFLSLDDMERLAKAYIFNCAYRKNAIVSMNSIFDEYNTLHPNDNYRYPEYVLRLDIKEEILDYYLRAVRFRDPFESFISFYHIFEYFFKICEEEFRRNISLEVTNQFAGSNKEFKDIIFKQNLNNERTLLELVFRRFIKDKKSFKKELNSINGTDYSNLKERSIKSEDEVDEENLNYYSYLQTKGIKFDSDEEKIGTRLDDNNFYKTLTERVYTVRNALVHRKEGHKGPKYLPFEKVHREELREELPLMKVIANNIILGSSN